MKDSFGKDAEFHVHIGTRACVKLVFLGEGILKCVYHDSITGRKHFIYYC